MAVLNKAFGSKRPPQPVDVHSVHVCGTHGPARAHDRIALRCTLRPERGAGEKSEAPRQIARSRVMAAMPSSSEAMVAPEATERRETTVIESGARILGRTRTHDTRHTRGDTLR